MTLKTFHTGLMKLVHAHSFARERGANLYWYYGNVFHRLRTFSSLSFFEKKVHPRTRISKIAKIAFWKLLALHQYKLWDLI